MDSQATLVDVNATLLAGSGASTVLLFSRDSLMMSILNLRETNRPVYIIKTNSTSSRTTVNRVIHGGDSNNSDVEVVRIDRSDLLSDKITFASFPTLKLKNWLKERTFTDP